MIYVSTHLNFLTNLNVKCELCFVPYDRLLLTGLSGLCPLILTKFRRNQKSSIYLQLF